MKFCNNCKKLTPGQPVFCQHCGFTYDKKLCPHRHENPRSAEFCSTCGSRDFSTPHPKPALFVRFLFVVLPLLPGVLLVLLSLLAIVGVIQALLTDEQLQARFVSAVLMLGLLWYCYLKLADSFAGKAIRKLLKKGTAGKGRGSSGGH